MSNIFTFTGRLTKDCHTGSTPQGKPYFVCTVATEAGYGDRKSTMFVDVPVFGKRAEGKLPEYLTKGTQVLVSGELEASTREYQGKTYLVLKMQNTHVLELIGGKREQERAPTIASQEKAAELDDDLPF